MHSDSQPRSRGLSPERCKQQVASAGKDKIREMLLIQLEELEMLTSMFPNSGELTVTDQSVIADINQFVECKSSTVPLHLEYIINLNLDDLKLELCANLPSFYPETEPSVFVRSDQLNRTHQTRLNSDVKDYVASLERGEICICSIVIWLQENAANYHQKIASPKKENLKESRESFSRLWIYSHHIYNKTKRKEILEQALDRNLSGFCLPGKPGIICVEGPSSGCSEWWQTIRNMTWQRIMCKKVEEEVIGSWQDLDSHRKFGKFQEVSFVNENATSKDQGKHMNMGDFYRYLQEHDCGEVFKDYFGIDGRSGDA
ncbi:unnamed protein product [Bemisia tabaci]|uniref:RWD domain-containing protein n=1 Tax=Bemisia tabaci TaxID=7038 RepID=A0A9P0EX81_BEMTA|nr:unnamed protein product [Bemisia tabaci]